MGYFLKLVGLLGIAGIISGCAGNAPKQTFNASVNKHINSISMVNAPVVSRIDVSMRAHPGSNFGLIGGLIAAADMQAKESSYNKAAGSTDWNSYTQQQITSALKQAGYSVSPLAVRADKDNALDYLEKYPDTSTNAILDYYFNVRQFAAGPTSNYVPSARLSARLVDAKDKTVLYEEQFSTGLAANKDDIHFASDKGYANSAALNANATESVAALKEGIAQMAQRLAQDLKRQ